MTLAQWQTLGGCILVGLLLLAWGTILWTHL